MKLKKALKLLSKGEVVKHEDDLIFSDVKTGTLFVSDSVVCIKIFPHSVLSKKGYKKYEPTEMERKLIGNFLNNK